MQVSRCGQFGNVWSERQSDWQHFHTLSWHQYQHKQKLSPGRQKWTSCTLVKVCTIPPNHSLTPISPQPRRCQHHRQQSGGASERSARAPWLCCSRRADWEAAALKVLSHWATYCWGLGRWKQFCSALYRLNCDFCSFDIFWTAGNHYQQTLSIGWSYLQAAIMLSCAQHFNCFFSFRAAWDYIPLSCSPPFCQANPKVQHFPADIKWWWSCPSSSLFLSFYWDPGPDAGIAPHLSGSLPRRSPLRLPFSPL